MANASTGNSAAGVASFVVSTVSGGLLALVVVVVFMATNNDPPGADETGYAYLVLLLVLATLLCQIVALGLGVAGVLQRRRRRLFALLGIACSVLVVATILSWAGPINLARLAAGLTQPQPEVHHVSPGNE